MFDYIRGTVAAVETGQVVLETGGVGFSLRTSYNSARGVKSGDAATFYTYLYVREDALDLYGFAKRDERACFLQLLSISGVGPKAALAILGVVTPEKLALSVLAGDEKALTAAPGVGKKLAQRILLELKDKMSKTQLESAGGAELLPAEGLVGGALEDAFAALAVLGYPRPVAAAALKGVEVSAMGTDEIVRAALKRLF